MNKTLFNILENYQNSDDLHFLLIKHNLDSIITNAIHSINERLNENEFKELPKISGIILNDINGVISNIKNRNEKKQIEYLLSDIFQDYIKTISIQDNSDIIIDEIIENLKIACEYRGYDYNTLTQILGLEKTKVLKPRFVAKKTYYEWLGKESELDEITRDLADKKIIYSIKEFKKLFKPITSSFYVKFNKEFKDEIIVFFQLLKNKKLIKPKGTSGHFAPLTQYSVDNEDVFLIKKAINKEHERIKKNPVRYNEIRNKLTLIIEKNLIIK
ncbi:hypothetical protein [uncultured Psychroserpens sp.]|uniref:hypothetical protein n=1 Tax=uncultured Psychroserpens sp. TaxID=255436 RepID=UPI00262E1372|nr:hypothetical protein [uncultured Psychroserpens sp.]